MDDILSFTCNEELKNRLNRAEKVMAVNLQEAIVSMLERGCDEVLAENFVSIKIDTFQDR